MDNKEISEELRGLPLRPCHHAGCARLTRGRYCDQHDRQHAPQDIRPADQQAWRRLYQTKRWQQLRAAQLMLSPFCAECAKAGTRTRASDVDHIIDHKGDVRLFFDADNLQSLCHPCHSRKTAASVNSAAVEQSPRGKKV